jgi:hypothetical protein
MLETCCKGAPQYGTNRQYNRYLTLQCAQMCNRTLSADAHTDMCQQQLEVLTVWIVLLHQSPS